MTISAIVAAAKNRVIGNNNKIPWHLPADLKFFKKTTMGHHIVMGRNTYESIGKPLPGRTNVVVSRDLFYSASGCLVVHSIEEALEVAKRNGEDEVFIIGGAEIYNQILPFLDRLYMTELDAHPEGDAYFPALQSAEWEENFTEAHAADERNAYSFTFRIFNRSNAGRSRLLEQG